MTHNSSQRQKPVSIHFLKPHPRKTEIFRNMSAKELLSLAYDIARHGLREPIDILPDGTILSGHQHILIALIGVTMVPVVIHDDLANRPAEAELFLLEANYNRRHLSPLGLAHVRGHAKARRIRGPLADRWSSIDVTRYFRREDVSDPALLRP